MFCKNCGKNLNQEDTFCASCGIKVENQINEVNNNENTPQITPNINDNQKQINSTSLQSEKPKKNKSMMILLIIGGIIVGIIILFVVIFSIVSANSDKLVCKSDKGNITIMYDKDGLTGYKAFGMSYDFENQKEYAQKIGIDAYLKEFNNWFTTNTSGTCTINGKAVENQENNSSTNSSNDTNNTNNSTSNSSTTVVGEDKYGYITIPSNWTKFYDVDGNSSLQYSYANVYIVSLNYFKDSQYSAKEYASNYMYNKQNSSDVTGVNGATVKIGKNKEYTAYQVYMYYPSSSTYLVTYWFEAEDGKVHYIALEGPEELNGTKITDYLYIAESFSLNK